ncbi:DUF1772 domain-containing protein [Amycolatopsis sp. NPDC004079]|uniref:DUF1772 domain-containing protein n=1 Tax=Amycolatopsis halotolerans TaxID=330083 RepID=A0ABV7QBR1_9PSEU
MSTVERWLAGAATVSSGAIAGVLFAVALAVLPALFAMPPAQYVYSHQLIGKRWDPTMPVLVLGSTALDVVLAFLVPGRAWLFGAGAGALAAVSVVSHFCNVPLNRAVKRLDPEAIPAHWADPRPLWRRWHLLRTGIAVLAAGLNAAAIS